MASSSAGAAAAAVVAGDGAAATQPSRGIELLTGPDGGFAGFSIGPEAQCYALVEQFLAAPKVLAFPTAERYGIAGKIAAAPGEHKRIVERLLAGISSSPAEAGALNALYLLQTCQQLVPGFGECVPKDRLDGAAEMSAHGRVQAAILKDEKPVEWANAEGAKAGTKVMLVQRPDDEPGVLEEAGDLLYDAGAAVGDGAKVVTGTAFGAVGAISDGLGITENASRDLQEGAHDGVDLLTGTVGAVVDTVGDGIAGTADDFAEKGVIDTVGDAANDSLDMVTGFVQDAVFGVADGVGGVLDWAFGTADKDIPAGPASHKVLIEVKDLIGEERSLGLRLEDRVLTRFTKPEAEGMGWKLGDCIIGMRAGPVQTQDEMLAAIASEKENLKNNGTPMRFVVERAGPKPAGQTSANGAKVGSVVRVHGRAAHVVQVDAGTGDLICQFQDDKSFVRVRA